MAAAGLWLLASAPAFAVCPTGMVGTQLAAGLWTIKIEGFAVDNATCGTSCPDPTPVGEGCFGVIQSDGACDIPKGDVICAFNSTITSPTTIGGIPAFGGTVSAATQGSYFFNSNNTGELVLFDSNSNKTMAFGVVAALGNSSISGASVFGAPGPISDPLILTVQKRDQTISTAQFEDQSSVTFDPAGGSSGGSGLGRGFDAVGVANEQHLDPETGTTLEGGGSIFFNVDGGYDSDALPGVQVFPSSLICDFHSTVLALNTGAGQDGTELSSAALNGDYSCPLGGAAFQTASVLYGATNSSAYTATTGSAGAAAHGLAIANGTRAIMAGSDQGQAVTLVQSGANPHPTKTAIITNGSTEPLDWTSITLSGSLTSVTIDPSSTCATAGGDLAAWNPVADGPVKPTCTVVLDDTGSTCNTGAGKEVGTYELVGADHAMISGTATGTGVTFAVTCE
ncbi:hypothetical protein [Candidatus Binatus sp.]|uniref:hypothetical protein n=1 Tax=Candidatus Binatus sp. TaxID=2811406 RepID=UPI003CC6342E